ncbi:hypothetical protein [Clostridium botulinum]|uniref:hypothetical protein n=1 Tax=Clostridium botulinum TaxID=1491 RepID=UPI0005F8B30C
MKNFNLTEIYIEIYICLGIFVITTTLHLLSKKFQINLDILELPLFIMGLGSISLAIVNIGKIIILKVLL